MRVVNEEELVTFIRQNIGDWTVAGHHTIIAQIEKDCKHFLKQKRTSAPPSPDAPSPSVGVRW